MKGILTLFLLSFSVLSFAQNKSSETVEIDDRLLEVYDKEYLEDLKIQNPVLLQRWSFYLDNAFYMVDFPKEKGNPDYPTIEVADLDNMNIFLLEKNQKMTRDFDKPTKYKIKGTNKILVYYSGKEFNQKLNNFLGRNYK
ncbi:MAG: hypothetical protein AB8F94_01740 [Saprospiraceae bacterium]